MDNTLLAVLLVCVVIVHVTLNRMPQRRYTAPVEYNSFEFRLNDIDDERQRRYMRFTKQEIRQILPFLDLDSVQWTNGYQPSSELAFCLVLTRLSFPQRLFQLSDLFGRSESYLSSVYNDTIDHLCRRYRAMLRWHPSLQYRRLRQYARAIKRVGGWRAEGTIWGFIDGTFRPTCRPRENQRFFYSGYKKRHGFKYQGIVCPDGLIGSIAGPFEGKANDVKMVKDSGVEEDLRRVCHGHPQIFLYGDQAYRRLWGIMGPYAGGRSLDYTHRQFNKTLSRVRIIVEQAFGDTQNLWLSNAFEQGLRPGSQPVAAYYMTSDTVWTPWFTSIASTYPVPPRSMISLGVQNGGLQQIIRRPWSCSENRYYD